MGVSPMFVECGGVSPMSGVGLTLMSGVYVGMHPMSGCGGLSPMSVGIYGCEPHI